MPLKDCWHARSGFRKCCRHAIAVLRTHRVEPVKAKKNARRRQKQQYVWFWFHPLIVMEVTGQTGETLVRVSLATIPEYLRTSQRYTALVANYEAEGTFEFPKAAFKEDLQMNSSQDVCHLLCTLQYWRAEVPDELRAIFFSDLELANDIQQFLRHFPSPLPALLNMFYASQMPPNDRMYHAAAVGDLDTMKYLRSIGCQWNHRECCIAAHHGQLHCLQYARENGCAWTDGMPKAECACYFAARAGHLSCLEYAHQHGCPQHCEFLVAPCRWKMDCLQYVLDHNFPVATDTAQAYRVFRDLTAQVDIFVDGSACLTSLQRRIASYGPVLQAFARQDVQLLHPSIQSYGNVALSRRPPPANSILGHRHAMQLAQRRMVGGEDSDAEPDDDMPVGSPSNGRPHHRHHRRLPENAVYRQMPRMHQALPHGQPLHTPLSRQTTAATVETEAETHLQRLERLARQTVQQQRQNEEQLRRQPAGSRRHSGILQPGTWYHRTPKSGQSSSGRWGAWPQGEK